VAGLVAATTAGDLADTTAADLGDTTAGRVPTAAISGVNAKGTEAVAGTEEWAENHPRPAILELKEVHRRSVALTPRRAGTRLEDRALDDPAAVAAARRSVTRWQLPTAHGTPLEAPTVRVALR